MSIRAAREAGFFVMVADRNPLSPGFQEADIALPIDLFDYETLLTAVRENGGVDGVVSMAEAGVRPAAYLAHRLGLPSITQEAAANATSKAAMRRAWHGSPHSVDFCIVNAEAEALEAVESLGSFPLLFKPDRSFGGSRGVSRVDEHAQVVQAYQFAKSGALPDSAVVIEQYISGTEHSAEVLIDKGKASVLCIGQKVKSPYPYRVDVSVQYPAPLSTQQENVVADMCQFAISSLGIHQGVAHVEFAYTPSGPVLFELGARCGGGHTPQIAQHVSGVHEFVEYCRIACGLPVEPFTPVARRGADYRFLIYPPGELVNIAFSEAVRSHPGIADVGFTFSPGDTVNPLRTTAERVGFVVALADTQQQAVDLGDWACSQVIASYTDGRTAPAYSLTELGPQTMEGYRG
jgi:biotin carboxylase